MNNKEMKKVGRKMKFHELWDKDRISIVIPKIQRDFAYGRSNNEKNRKRFLDSICEAIAPGVKKELELDFVFGRLDKKKTPLRFEPIDGQQRLTILFLLYLYVGKRSRQDDKTLEFLEHFTYETRDSSTEFCRKIIRIAPKHFDSDVVDFVKDQWWYNSGWKADPTISSMLVILNDIHKHHENFTESKMMQVWDTLCRNISFWEIDLDDLDTTDTLYIKMNSRGKSLDNFEHFKAELDRYSGSGRLSMKIDTAWTNLLWQYRATKDNANEVNAESRVYADNGLDKLFTNLFYRILVLENCKAGNGYPNDSNYKPSDILQLADEILPIHPEYLERIETCLDFFAALPSVADFFKKFITCSYAQTVNDIPATEGDYRVYVPRVKDFLQLATAPRTEVSLSNMLFIEAFLEYAYWKGKEAKNQLKEEDPGISEAEFKDRLRILRNLQNNLQVHNHEMEGLLNATGAFVRTGDLDLIAEDNAYTQLQKNQEHFKRDIWKKDHTQAAWLTLVTLENTWFLYGNLSPIMRSENSLEVKYMTGFLQLFSHEPALNSFRKALLTFGDYSTKIGAERRYASDDWNAWYGDIFIFANKSFSKAFTDMVDNWMAPMDVESRNQGFEDIVSEYRQRCVRESKFPWIYYMVTYQNIFNNPRHGRKFYRPGKGLYNHKMVTGSKGKSWNPYHMALLHCLPDAKLDNWDSPLIFESKEIYVSEREVMIKYPIGVTVKKTIPCDYGGIDTVDRVDYIRRLLLNIPIREKRSKSKKLSFKGYKYSYNKRKGRRK